MPTYTYRCEACGFEFERVQRMTEDAIKDCPQCGKAQARRTITTSNFILKGGGWYSDLYSGGSNKKGAAASAKSEGGAEAKAESSTETKSESKTESPAASTTVAAPATSTPSSSTGSSSS